MCISIHDTPGGWNPQKKGAGCFWGVPRSRGEASGMGCVGSPVTPFPDASPLQKRGSRSAGWGGVPRSRGRSVHGLTSPSPRIDLPLQKQGLRSAVGQVCAWVDLALSAHRPAPTKTGIAVGAQGQVCSWVDLSLSAHRPAPTKTGDRGRHLQ